MSALADSLGAEELWDLLGLDGRPTRSFIDERPLPPPPLSAISLNVAQACNMACSYCYADAGRFGGKARMMAPDIARRAVDRLIAEAQPGADLLLGFMGGEPLLNRDLVHAIVPHPTERGAAAGHRVRFSITTNATLLTPPMRGCSQHQFAVRSASTARQRQRLAAGDAHPAVLNAWCAGSMCSTGTAVPSAQRPGHRHGNAGALLPMLEHLIGLGFDDVGLPPAVSPRARQSLDADGFAFLLREMLACGQGAEASARAARSFGRFPDRDGADSRGSHRPYPAVPARLSQCQRRGRLFACHRLVDDGLCHGRCGDRSDRKRAPGTCRRATSMDEPCRARARACAAAVATAGCQARATGLDYIRGWLEFCLAPM